MALANPIFTLVVGVQLFCAAFDLILAVVPLKVALGLEKVDYLAFQQNKHASGHQMSFIYFFFKCPKIIFLQA